MEKTKLLIATTNQGKFKEIKSFLMDLPFCLVSLADLDLNDEVDEPHDTLWQNSYEKASYFANKTGLLTMAEDTGFFVDYLDGFPGVNVKKQAPTSAQRLEKLLQLLDGVEKEKRTAYFKTTICFFDPTKESFHFFNGKAEGLISEKIVGEYREGAEHDSIFYYPPLKKHFCDLTIEEKNGVSHRGKALISLKYFLQNNFGSKHIVVPFALVIKDKKVLMIKRNDPHRKEYHGRWEFPGGSVDFGETMYSNVIKETKEEAGYDVEVVKMLQHIAVEEQEIPNFKLQIYLVPYVCKIVGGNGEYSDAECLGTMWCELDDVLNYDLVGENERMYRIFLPELKEVVKTYNL